MNKNIVYVSPSFPAFHAWSDMLLRERQKYEEKEDCFGVGDLVELEPVVLVKGLKIHRTLLFL